MLLVFLRGEETKSRRESERMDVENDRWKRKRRTGCFVDVDVETRIAWERAEQLMMATSAVIRTQTHVLLHRVL